MRDLPSGTVTFLFTDIEGSTDLARRLGADFASLRAEHRPWQILVSYATEALLEGEAPEFTLEDLGERTLTGRDRPDRVFGVPV
jgi:class 3 adenylate cyclase